MARKLRPLAVPEEHKLTVREILFVGALMEGKTLTAAGEAVDISPSAAHAWADRPAVAAELRRRQQALTKRTAVTEDRILEELAAVALTSLGDMVKVSPFTGDPYIDWEALTPAQKAAIAEIDIHYDPVPIAKGEAKGPSDQLRTAKRVKIKLHPKLQALDQVSKILGIYKAAKVDVSVTGEVTHKLETSKVLRELSADALAELELALQKASSSQAEDAEVVDGSQ